MKIFVIDRNGSEQKIDGHHNARVMELIRNAGLPIRAECGGNCVCATCHVYVNKEWLPRLPPPLEIETELLTAIHHARFNSRLSCQIIMSEEFDGLRVTLAPEET